MTEALAVAERLDDGRARAYARAGLLHCRTRLGLDTLEEAERRKAELFDDCERLGDNFLRNSVYFFASWDYLYRGLVKDARDIALRIIASSEAIGDPRAIGFANWMLGWIHLVGGHRPRRRSPTRTNACASRSRRSTGFRAQIITAFAAILSGRAREGLGRRSRRSIVEFERLGALYSVLDAPRGVALIELGRDFRGFRVLEQDDRAREAAGDRTHRRRSPASFWPKSIFRSSLVGARRRRL